MTANHKPIFAGYELSFVEMKNMLALVVYFPGCNLNCPFCHNKELLYSKPLFTHSDILYALDKTIENTRSKVGIVFSGGEPTYNKKFAIEISKFTEFDFDLGLHTNGFKLFEEYKPYHTIVLSIKSPIIWGFTKEQYYNKLLAACKHYQSANYKKLVLVKDHEGFYKEAEYILHKLQDMSEVMLNWEIEIVKDSRRK